MKKRIVLAILFGLFIFALLPSTIVAVNDDFGYLRSIVATLQHGRPWTADWLEPWAASLSALSALVFRGTGSFYLATYGVLALLAALGFFALVSLLRCRSDSENLCLTVAALLLTGATVLWKELEFTSMAVYGPCLVGALWAGEKRRWLTFVVFWLIGMAARQSALAWAVIPAMDLACTSGAEWRTRLRNATPPLLALAVGAAGFAWLSRAMNVTHAQTVITDHLVHMPSIAALAHRGGLALAIFLCVGGIAGLVWGICQRNSGIVHWNGRRALVVLPAAVYFCCVDERRWVEFEHLCYADTLGLVYLRLLVLLAAAGWILGGFCIKWRYVIYMLPSVALLSLRGTVWDYYFVDIGVFAFLAIMPRQRSAPSTSAPWPLPMRLLAVLLAAFHLTFALELKFTLDRDAGVCRLAEHALRKSRLQPTELSFAPFGFIGWYWYPYYIRHEGARTDNIAGFGIYLQSGAVDVGQAYSRPLHLLPRFRHTPPADRSALIDWGEYRFSWVFWSQYYLLHAPAARVTGPEAQVGPHEFHPTRFPLNDAEWRELISRRGNPN